MITEQEIVIRLAIASVLGMIVGFERERQNQPAGLRTHTILAIGSCLAMTISINLAMQFTPLVPNGDPARLAAQVVSGIGFLGAGAILRYGTSVKGLTTATSLWTTAMVGLAIGAGHFFSGSGKGEEPAYPGAFAVTEPNEPHGLKAVERTVMLAVIAPRP